MTRQDHSQRDSRTRPDSPAKPAPSGNPYRPDAQHVLRELGKRSFGILATTSPGGRAHAAAVLYELVEGDLYVNTRRSSRKARNILANPGVAMSVPVRRLPVGPPSTIQFQGEAEILDLDCAQIRALLQKRRLRSITGHGELEEADGCFLRIRFGPRLLTYGLGMSIPQFVRDPLHAGGIVELSRAR